MVLALRDVMFVKEQKMPTQKTETNHREGGSGVSFSETASAKSFKNNLEFVNMTKEHFQKKGAVFDV